MWCVIRVLLHDESLWRDMFVTGHGNVISHLKSHRVIAETHQMEK